MKGFHKPTVTTVVVVVLGLLVLHFILLKKTGATK